MDPGGRGGSVIFAEILLVLGFSLDASALRRLLQTYGGEPLEDLDSPDGVILGVQDWNGSYSLYRMRLSTDEELRSFLEDADRSLHVKAVLELKDRLPFQIFCRVRRYEGSARFGSSLEGEDS